MTNRTEVYKAAWRNYRLARPAFFALGDTADRRAFLPKLFGRLLRQAWDDARTAEVTDTAQAFVSAQARVMADKAAALPEGERSARVSQLRDELALLDYAPLGVRTAPRRVQLSAELRAFGA